MDGRTETLRDDRLQESAAGDAERVSLEHVGRWNRLVSTTNWEKGRIILEWRTALIAAEAAAAEYSDEAWSLRVGGVSSQHVGRLRRVHERFVAVKDSYAGLYWSHFQAALDWSDAEMWLEGAVQNDWSVAHMRTQRWETLGGLPADEPQASDIAAADYDEDAEPAEAGSIHESTDSPLDEIHSADDVDHASGQAAEGPVPFDADAPFAGVDAAASRPFADLAALPDDLAEAFESFKLAIVRHRLDGWRDVARDDVLHALEALKSLTLSSGV